MSIIFNAVQLTNTAHPLYRVEAVDETENVLMVWQIAIKQDDDIQAIAKEGYLQAIANPIIT